jgi:hypothetical protein
MAEVVEVRCPVGPRRLFTKVKLGEEFERYIQPENWIEFTCSDCAKRLSKQRGERLRVFHRYTFIGELVQTVVADHEFAQAPQQEG